MRVLLGYPIWNKQDAGEWLASGVHRYTDYKTTDVALYFDGCTDGSEARFRTAFRYVAPNHPTISIESGANEIHEGGCHDYFLRLFEAHPEYDMLVVFQDDHRIIDKNFLPSLEQLYKQHGDSMGVVGCRDGFGPGYSDFVKSPWSESVMGRATYPAGNFTARPLHNRGPVCYPRGITQRIGHIDLINFPFWYAEIDYSWRSHQAGLTTGHLSTNFEHFKVGRQLNTGIYDGRHAADLERLTTKHGRVLI